MIWYYLLNFQCKTGAYLIVVIAFFLIQSAVILRVEQPQVYLFSLLYLYLWIFSSQNQPRRSKMCNYICFTVIVLFFPPQTTNAVLEKQTILTPCLRSLARWWWGDILAPSEPHERSLSAACFEPRRCQFQPFQHTCTKSFTCACRRRAFWPNRSRTCVSTMRLPVSEVRLQSKRSTTTVGFQVRGWTKCWIFFYHSWKQ